MQTGSGKQICSEFLPFSDFPGEKKTYKKIDSSDNRQSDIPFLSNMILYQSFDWWGGGGGGVEQGPYCV